MKLIFDFLLEKLESFFFHDFIIFGGIIVMGSFLGKEAVAYTFFVDEVQVPRRQLAVSYWPDKAINPRLNFFIDVDQGRYEGFSAFQIAQKALHHWDTVPQSRLRLGLSSLGVDIDEKNFRKFVRWDDGHPQLLIDREGAILESLGIDSKYVAGLGIPVTKEHSRQDLLDPSFGGEIVDAVVIINTKLAWNASLLERVMTHEIGHALGLAHSNVAYQRDPNQLPVMFYDPLKQGPLQHLHQDDKSALASLYPTLDFERHFGAIKGTIFDSKGQPLFAISLLAIPLNAHQDRTVGGWSDQNGQFVIYALPPGRYELLALTYEPHRVDNYQNFNPELHVGGIFGFNAHFCPEFFNDHPFAGCGLVKPVERDSILVQPYRTTAHIVLRAGAHNPSKPPRCLLGSFPQLWGHFRRNLPRLSEGKRGENCSYSREKMMEVREEKELFFEEKIREEIHFLPERTSFHEILVEEHCGCQSSRDVPFFFLEVFIFFLFLSFMKCRKV